MSALPIDSIRAEFEAALAAGHVVVEAPTGSGKSTRLPLWCGARGRTLVVEPRRLACRALARHLAEEAGTALGEEIGYAVRFDSRYGMQTQVVFVTPGIALRWLADGALAGFAHVILDEFHERRWDTDLLIALLRRKGAHRLVVTSATVEGGRLADYLGGARLEAQGRLFPVEVRYTEENALPRTRDLAARVAAAVAEALAETDAGDVLVFLPGRGEIQGAAQALEGRVQAEVIPLYAGVDNAIQDRALRAADHRRVILATNVAETSLTIPGVTVVIDSGLERRTHHRNGRTVLGLHQISQAAAEQRRGRAGRLGPGRCLRLWGRPARLEPFTPPEVAREELTELFLAAAAAGTAATDLLFPDPLPAHAVERTLIRLRGMQAIDAEGHLTEHGRRLFPLPLEPLFAHLITAMPDATTRAAMVDLAAALSVGRPLLRPIRDAQAGEALRAWVPEACDAATLIRLVREDAPRAVPVNQRALTEARRIADHTRTALGLGKRTEEALPRSRLLEAALRAVPDLAYVRRARRRHALGNGESEVEVGVESRFPEEAEAALVFDEHSVPARGTNKTLNLATCMAPVPLSLLAELGLGELEHGAPTWEEGSLVVERRRRYAGRVIATETTVPEGPVLRRAAAQLILEGRLKPPVGEWLREDVEAWNLYLALGHGEGTPEEPPAWLERRLERLGVETAEDLELIEAEDLRFEEIPAWERERFDGKYPRRVELANLSMAVHYEPHRRRVTLERRGGKRRTPPMLKELPVWSGWSVRYRDASRVVTIK